MPLPDPAREGYADRVLWTLRIFGPCSIADLRLHLKNEGYVYSAVYKHRVEGRAIRLGEALYDVTDKGRAYLAALKGLEIDARNRREANQRLPLFDGPTGE